MVDLDGKRVKVVFDDFELTFSSCQVERCLFGLHCESTYVISHHVGVPFLEEMLEQIQSAILSTHVEYSITTLKQ